MRPDAFDILKTHAKTHKEAAKLIGLSYTRYNEWRWDPSKIPEYGKKLLELTVDQILALDPKRAPESTTVR